MSQTVLLGDVVEVNPSAPIKKGEDVKFVSMDAVQPFQRNITYLETREYKGGAKFRNGDTLLARITPCLENGKTAFVDFLDDNETAAGSTEFTVLRATPDTTDSEFIYYLSRSPEFRAYAIQSMVGTSGRQRVQTDQLKSFEFKLPSLNEQKEIAKVLSGLDQKIELNRRMNETLEEMGQALFKHYFIDNPEAEEWDKFSLDDIAEFLNGLAMQKHPPKDTENILPVIKIRELNSGITDATDFVTSDIPEKYIVCNGDMLFSWSGTLKVKIWTEGNGGLNQHLFKVTSDKYPQWLYYYWTKYHLNQFVDTAANKATTMGHIQRRHLKEARASIPGNNKLKEVDQYIAPLHKQRVNCLLEINNLAELRDSLLPRLMSGKVKM
ncbi:restriction endonuclease subunit S [Candidatus Saccharibacteria bacterium QS_5_54_17]|nr:MAG: restriction endonuclease subunit S [Candidatus Saccharibacteria bacterium QS_5_54_17]